MSGLVIGGIASVAGGLLVTVLGLVLWVRARRRSARAEGVVVGLEDRGSGEYPVVQFTPDRGAAPITLRSSVSHGGHRVGDRVAVFHQPGDPTHATIQSPAMASMLAVTIGGSGLICLPLGALLLVLAPVGEARDAAVMELAAAARTGDPARLAAAAPGAQVDVEFLLREAPRSRSTSIGSNTMGFDDACVEVILRPQQVPFLAYLERRDERWSVVRAGPDDAACAAELR